MDKLRGIGRLFHPQGFWKNFIVMLILGDTHIDNPGKYTWKNIS
jgi:hypothetical protein